MFGWIKKAWWSMKQSAVGHAIALYKAGQAVWTPRNYEALAREGYQKNVVVYASISEVAKGGASVPFQLFRRQGEELREIKNHPLLTLLKRPNPMQGGAAFFQAVYSYYQIAGNSYLEAVRVGLNGSGEPRELYTHRPDRTKVVPGVWGFPLAYRYTVSGIEKDWDVDPATGDSPFFLHVKTFHPLNDWYGMSALEAAAFSVDIHNQTGGWNKSLLDNGARPSGALTYTAGKGEPSVMGEDEYKRLKSQIDEDFVGAANSGRPLILEGGLGWQEMSLSPKEMDYIQSKNTSARDISLAFGVPPQLLGIQGDSTYNNQREARLALYEQTILPMVDLFVAELNQWLVPMFSDDLVLKYDEDQINALAPRREVVWEKVGGATFLTDNEKREAVGYEPIDGGEVLFKPVTLAPVSFLVDSSDSTDDDEEMSMKFFNLGNRRQRIREWRIQDRLMRNHERGLEKTIRDLIIAQGKKSAIAFIDDGEHGADLSLADHSNEIKAALETHYNSTIESFGNRVIEGLKEHGPAEFKSVESKDIEDFFGALKLKWVVANIGRKVKLISKQTREIIMRAIDDGQREEDSLTEISKRIEAGTSGVIAGVRARTIAATEVHAAAIAGNDIGAEATGLKLGRQWLSALDSDVRESHMQADGQTRPMGEPFDVGGAKLLRPGDPSGPPEETINCRCTVIYQTEEAV